MLVYTFFRVAQSRATFFILQGEVMLEFLQKVNSVLADYILIILLIGVGLFFTIRSRFVQIRCFGEGMKNVFG